MKASIVAALFLLTGYAQAGTILQSYDFEDGQLPDSLSSWYSTNGGSVEVVGPVYNRTDSNTMRFNNQTWGTIYEREKSSLQYEFDLVNSGEFIFSSYYLPGDVAIKFKGGSVSVRVGTVINELGTFAYDDINFKLRTRLPTESWQMWINDQALFGGSLSTSDIRRADFRLQSQYGNHYIDNLSITAVPVPAAAWLFMSALISLGYLRRPVQA